jgi:hypothetical protein
MELQVSEVEPARNRAGTPLPDRNRFRLETPGSNRVPPL